MGQPEGQVQYYTRETVTAALTGAAVPSITASDISFRAQDNSINSTSTDFVASGFANGMLVVVTGTQANNDNFLLVSVTQRKMIVAETSVCPESAGSSFTIGPTYLLRANQGNKQDNIIGERSYICTVCNHAFPESKMQYFRGKWYCVPNGDYKDIASILKVEWARGYKPAGMSNDQDRVSPTPIIKG